MSELAIRATGLSKQYRIGAPETSYGTLRDVLTNWTRFFYRRKKMAAQKFWALEDVSFEIKHGEVVGVIGRNGAGKSTLLKILSRITRPTRGRADIYGRIGSLLEVGTGFHPELTGRENVFLNGAILGMSRRDIQRKFDEIVAFAGVEKFLDTPVKFYSSGMYVRLAFAVAAHLEPEILLVDEVLAVGDIDFQKKSLGKMEAVSKEGRTVIFVSHNMPAVTRICSHALLLDQGHLVKMGLTHEIVGLYMQSGTGSSAHREWLDEKTAPGNQIARLRAVRVYNQGNNIAASVDIRELVKVEVEFDVLEGGHILVPGVSFYNEEGICLFNVWDKDPNWERTTRPTGKFLSAVHIPGNFFAEGLVVVESGLATPEPFTVHYDEKDVVAFQVIDSMDGDSVRGNYGGPWPGVVRPMLKWTTKVYSKEAL